MAEQPDFWSAEGFPYPLIALAQTFPRGYQYQSQMTPYKRDARGDWGRALNESIDQFLGMMPQYMQQRRQFALQRDQLARQRLADQHQAKLRPFELKKMRAEEQIMQQRMQMLKNYPKIVEDLPVEDRIKSFLLTQSPEKGTALINTYLAQGLKKKTKLIPAGTPIDGKTYDVDLQQKADGTLVKVPVSIKKLLIQPGEEIPGSGGKINTFKVPLEYDQENNTWKFLKPPKQVKTYYKGDILPNGRMHEGDTPVQIDVTSEVMTYPEGTAKPKNLITIQPGEKDPLGNVNILEVPVQFDTATNTITTPYDKAPQEKFVSAADDPRIEIYPEVMRKYLQINKRNNEISFPPAFTKEMQKQVLKEARPSATKRFSKWLEVPGNQVQSFADLEPWTGTSLESKLWFATQNLPRDHKLHIDAQNQLNLKHIKITPNAIIVGRGYKDPNRPDLAKRLPEPKTKRIETGDSVSSLAQRFGTTESQIIAANPDWFKKDMNGRADIRSMRTSEQMEGAEMIIPTGKSQLTPGQIREAHSSKRRARVTEMPYGTIIPIQTATVGDGLRLNTERLEMQNIQKSVKDFVELMQNPKARGFGKIGKKEKGELEGIRQRLINNVQVLRDYGVLSPSEIQNIERSVPAVNSIIALMTRGLGSDEFVVGAMNKLYEEAVNNERKLDALIKLYGAPVVDYERYEGGIPGFDATSGGSEIEILDNELDSFGG